VKTEARACRAGLGEAFRADGRLLLCRLYGCRCIGLKDRDAFRAIARASYSALVRRCCSCVGCTGAAASA
jgi:hypothetical protein